MKKPFFVRYGLILLMVVFFFAPFGLRGARLAVQRMKNDVKDWLPADFAETRELDWFRAHFLGEQFVVVSWEGCTGRADDHRFMDLIDSFFPEIPPSERARRLERAIAELDDGETPPVDEKYPNWPVDVDRERYIDPDLQMYVRQLQVGDVPPPEEHIGNKFRLDAVPNDFTNWGGQQEKWVQGGENEWFYITPNGDLYRWKGGSSVLQPLINIFRRWTRGPSLEGDLVKSFGPVDGPWYYEDPRRLSARLFKTVTTGPGVLDQLTGAGETLDGAEQTGFDRLSGSLFGPDNKQTCLVATLTEAAKADLRFAIGRGILGKRQGEMLKLANAAGVNPPPQPSMLPPVIADFFQPPPVSEPVIRMGGPSVDNAAIDEEGQITIVRLIGLSLLVGIGLSWISFRSVNLTIMVFLVGGLSAVASLSFVYWCGSSVDAVLMSMPSLVYVLGLSGAVHIVNYYRDAISDVGLQRAPTEAIRVGWKPCVLAAITTALGLLSLNASHIIPIQKFGVFSAVGVLATLILLFTYLPAALQMWPPKRYRQTRSRVTIEPSRIERWITSFWRAAGEFVIKHYVAMLVVCCTAFVVLGYGLTRINTDVQLLKMFDKDAKIIRDYKWLETHLGKLVPMELVVQVDSSALHSTTSQNDTTDSGLEMLSFLERMEIVHYIEQALRQEFGTGDNPIIGRPMSATTFAMEMPKPGGGFSARARRGGTNRRLEAHRGEFFESDFLRVDQATDAELWRISLRLGALDDIDYRDFVLSLKEAVEPVVSAYQYRQQILDAIASKKGADAVRKTKVFLVGPFGKSRTSKNLAADSESSDAMLTNQADQKATKIFATTLSKLLLNAGFSVRDWYDPRFEAPADWHQALADQECVLVVDADTDLVTSIQNAAPLLIDARDHHFDVQRGTSHEQPKQIVTTYLAHTEEALNPKSIEQNLDRDVSVVYTGLVPVVYKAQRTLLESLIESTAWAFAMIAVVMVLVVRSVRAGLLSMIPNVFPVVAVFGIMGWSNVLVDIGSMMTASVAMGVAVDDTIHFLTWFRRGLNEGKSRKNAILLAYERVGMAMTQTTAIGGLGLSIFAFSTFTPTQRFGTLMLALLAAALVGDLVFLPAMLVSPVGRVFDRQKSKPSPSSSDHGRPTSDKRRPLTRHSRSVTSSVRKQ